MARVSLDEAVAGCVELGPRTKVWSTSLLNPAIAEFRTEAKVPVVAEGTA